MRSKLNFVIIFNHLIIISLYFPNSISFIVDIDYVRYKQSNKYGRLNCRMANVLDRMLE